MIWAPEWVRVHVWKNKMRVISGGIEIQHLALIGTCMHARTHAHTHTHTHTHTHSCFSMHGCIHLYESVLPLHPPPTTMWFEELYPQTVIFCPENVGQFKRKRRILQKASYHRPNEMIPWGNKDLLVRVKDRFTTTVWLWETLRKVRHFRQLMVRRESKV